MPVAKFSKELHKADTRLLLSFMRHLNSAVVQECHMQWSSDSSQLGEKVSHSHSRGIWKEERMVVKPWLTLVYVAP